MTLPVSFANANNYPFLKGYYDYLRDADLSWTVMVKPKNKFTKLFQSLL